jgi:hypothetical protein
MRDLPIVDVYGDGLTNIITELHRSTSNITGERWELRVRDTLSGEQIISLELDDEGFSKLMSQRNAYAKRAEFTEADGRVGKRRVRHSELVPHGVVDQARTSELREYYAKSWAEQLASDTPALRDTEAISVYKNKAGWHANFDRWESP